MAFHDLPIKRKLVMVIMLTSVVVLLLTAAAFMVYELLTYRQAMLHDLATTAAITADNSTAALAFQTQRDARQVLGALRAAPHIVSAALYDKDGQLFLQYPPDAPTNSVPSRPAGDGTRFESNFLVVWWPVAETEERLGTLYLKSDLGELHQKMWLYGLIVALVLAGSLLVAFFMSEVLQRGISRPVLALTQTARQVSEQGDYGVRAQTTSGDELGVLTDAFNLMLTRVQAGEESSSFLVAIVASSDDAIIGKDLTGKVMSWNAGAERMFGYKTAEMIGQPITKLVSPDRPEEEAAILAEVQKGETRHYETIRVRKDGRPMEVALTVSPIRNARHQIVGASSIARDITARNRDQRALLGSESQLRLIWENVLDGMRLANEEGKILRVNEAYCRMVEKSREALEGLPMTTPYDSSRAEEILRLHRERFRSRSVPAHIEQRVTIWNGKMRFLEVRNSFLEIPGQTPLLVSTFRDISRRKEAEQREGAFAHLARSLSAAASATAAARSIADSAFDLMGWDACSLDLYSEQDDRVTPIINIDTIEGKRVDVPPAYGGHAPSRIVRQVLTEGGQLILREEPFQLSPGAVPFGDVTRPSASLMFVPIRLGQRTIGVLSIQSYTPQAYSQADLTTLQTLADQCSGAIERIRAEEEVRRINADLELRVAQRTAELRAANKEMESFTYSVAHDLRAPLRHISAFTRILHEDFEASLPPEAIEFLDGIQKSSQNMSCLVDDLLNLARVGRQELKREPTPLNDVVGQVVSDLNLEASNRKIEWHIQTLPVVQCDPGLIKVVLSNLLSNAVKYTRPRPVAVIEVGCLQRNGHAAIFVKDNGVGFNMKHAGKLFGVFQRLHQAEEFEGTGVGLATVERIIRKHGGSVWVEAELDKGATFFFTISGLDRAPARAAKSP